jgi:hypothetical protein
MPDLLALLVAALLFIPLAMAIVFAPALVILDDLVALEEMKLSVIGCLKNIAAKEVALRIHAAGAACMCEDKMSVTVLVSPQAIVGESSNRQCWVKDTARIPGTGAGAKRVDPVAAIPF